jgi:hypothetical protein
MSLEFVWLASYPRSGNTFVRTVLAQCFGLKSGSLYGQDLGNDPAVEALAGHIEQGPDGRIRFGEQRPRLVKTHHLPMDAAPAIYVLRDGRDAVVSLYHFLGQSRSLLDIVEGRTLFGTWADHASAWRPELRPNTLFLRYEDLVEALPAAIDQIAAFIGVVPSRRSMPGRDALAQQGGKWIRPTGEAKANLEGEAMRRFWDINGAEMQRYGYLRSNAKRAGGGA